MATQQTTLVGAITAKDQYATFALAPPYPQNSYALIDGELCAVVAPPFVGPATASTTQTQLRRGLDGGTVTAHAAAAPVVIMQGADLAQPLPGSEIGYPQVPPRSFAAAGAIDPNPGIVFLNGGAAMAMTLAPPAAGFQGQLLTVVSTTKFAHTLAVSGTQGVGGHTITFPAYQNTVTLVAAVGGWTLGALGMATFV